MEVVPVSYQNVVLSVEQWQQLQSENLFYKQQIEKLSERLQLLTCDKVEIQSKNIENSQAISEASSLHKADSSKSGSFINLNGDDEKFSVSDTTEELACQKETTKTDVQSSRQNGCWANVVGSTKIEQNNLAHQPNTHFQEVNNSKLTPPPIEVRVSGKAGYTTLKTILSREFGYHKYSLSPLYFNQLAQIQATNKETHSQITASLVRKGYLNCKNYFILRKLNEVKDIDSIHKELTKVGFPKETTVTQYMTRFQKAHPELKHNTLYRVATPNSFEEENVLKVNKLFGRKVQFEKMWNIN